MSVATVRGDEPNAQKPRLSLVLDPLPAPAPSTPGATPRLSLVLDPLPPATLAPSAPAATSPVAPSLATESPPAVAPEPVKRAYPAPSELPTQQGPKGML